MITKLHTSLIVLPVLCCLPASAQNRHAIPITIPDSASATIAGNHARYQHGREPGADRDLIDVVANLMKRPRSKDNADSATPGKLRLSAVPAAGYTLQTGFAVIGVANVAFNTHRDANISTVFTNITYTERKQIILPLQANIWTRNNKYNIFVDWRYLQYPSYTYGLGGYTRTDDGYTINYSAIRLHQTVFREVAKSAYVGLGYNYDYFWDVKEIDPPQNTTTDFQDYGLGTVEKASGFTFNFLYDSRKNSINADGGLYANLIYRPNPVFMGNPASWQSLTLDVRKYIRFPQHSDNVLAFWSYDWFTLAGNPPYLLLPNTGGDPYSNTGRGYIQSRFRGRNMLYLEGEYRFKISRNGLLGGVVFANGESFSETGSNRFEMIAPAFGGGIRIKLNKFSRTNIAIDYGVDPTGAGGFFVNLGEVF